MLSPHSAGDGAGEGDRPLALGFYRFLNRLKWPRTYLGRLILVCAVASSLPLFLVLLIVNLIYVETGSRPGGLDLGVFVAITGGRPHRDRPDAGGLASRAGAAATDNCRTRHLPA